MEKGFSRWKASSILTGNIKPGTRICLFAGEPDENGEGSEPSKVAGYIRQNFGAVSTQKEAQVANAETIFIFEALADCGTITHIGLSDSDALGDPAFLVGKLLNPITVGAGYVPLIRKFRLIVGLDVEKLDEDYKDEE